MSAIKINGTWQRVSSIKIKQDGVWSDHTALYARLDGAWHLIDLTAEAQGPAYHVWKAYADDALGNGISLSPEGKEYIGFAVGQRTEEPDLSDPSLYDWSLIKGADGKDGQDVDPEVLDEILEKQNSYNSSLSDVNDGLSAVEQALADADSRLKAADTALNQALQAAQVDFSNSVDSLNQSIGDLDTTLSGQVQDLDDSLSKQIQDLDASTAGHVSRIDTKLNGVDSSLTSITTSMNSEFDRVDSSLAAASGRIGEVENDLLNLTSLSGEQGSSITQLENATDEQAQKISVLETNDGSTRARVASLESTSGEQATRLSSLGVWDGEAFATIKTLEEADAENASLIRTLETRGEEADSKIATLESTSSSHSSRLTNVETKATNTQNRVATVEETTLAHATRLTNVETKASDTESKVSTLEETSEGHASRLTNVETKATTGVNKANAAQASADTANEAVGEVTNRVSTLEETSEGHASRLTNVETKATTGINKANAAQASADAANSGVSEVTNRVSTLEETSEGHASRLTNVETKATTGINKANAAQASADTANEAVGEVTNRVSTLEETSEGHASRLTNVETKATSAVTKADNAQSTANSGMSKADAAQSMANSANTKVTAVTNRVTSLEETSEGHASRLTNVETKATMAVNKADAAQDSADSANTKVSSVTNRVGSLEETSEGHASRLTNVETKASNAESKANNNSNRVSSLESTSNSHATRLTNVESVNLEQLSGSRIQSALSPNIGWTGNSSYEGANKFTLACGYAGKAALRLKLWDAEGGLRVAFNGTEVSPRPKGSNEQTKWFEYLVDAQQGDNEVAFWSSSDGGKILRIELRGGDLGSSVQTLESTSTGHASRLTNVETKATTAVSKADAAQSTANSGVSKANAAQSTANSGVSKANAAQTAADNAQETADSANTKVTAVTNRVSTLEDTSEGHASRLTNVETKATSAVTKADNAQSTANSGVSKANAAQSSANEANTKITTVTNRVSTLEETSEGHASRLTNVETKATTGVNKANAAQASADDANEKVSAVTNRVSTLEETSEGHASRLTTVETTATSGVNKANAAQSTADAATSKANAAQSTANSGVAKANAAQAKADSVDSKVTTVTNRVSTLETSDADKASRLSAIESIASKSAELSLNAASDFVNSEHTPISGDSASHLEALADGFKSVGTNRWRYSREYFKVDPRRRYEVRVRAREVSSSSNGKNYFYAGVVPFNADKAEINVQSGGAGTHLYVAASSYNLNGRDDWVELSGIITGIGLGSKNFREGTRYVRLMYISGYRAEGSPETEIDFLEIRDITEVDAISSRVTTLEETSEGHASRLTTVETTATSGVNKANAAQSTANSATTKANNAQNTANSATTKANNAQNAADQANEKITAVTNRVSTLEETSEGHASRLSTVETTATSGVNKANAAQSTANSATTKANNAQSTANSATTKANNAQSAADDAQESADAANSKVNAVTNRVSTLEETSEGHASRLSSVETKATSGVNKADAAQAKANSADSKVNAVTTRVTSLETTSATHATKIDEVSLSRSNIVTRGVFGADLSRGGWTAGSVVSTQAVGIPTLSGRPYVLKLTTRDCYDYNAKFPISVGDKIYISAWVYTTDTNVSFNIGFRQVLDGVEQSSWPTIIRTSDRSGKWVYVEGTYTHTASGYNGLAPFLQLGGSGTMPPVYISDIVYSRSSHSGALAAVTDESKAYVDQQTGELKAERVIKADANGKVSGVHLLANGSGAEAGGKLYFQADEIAIVPPNWNGISELDKSKFPFYFSEDRNYMYLDEATIQRLSAETIDSGSLAVDGLTLLSDNLSLPAGSVREHMLDPAFKDGIVRINPDAEILGGTKSVSSTGIGQGKKITVPALKSGGSAQKMTISVVGPNEVNRKDVQFDLEMKVNGAPYNFSSGQSKIRLSSTIKYSTEDGGVRLYRSSFNFEDTVTLPAPTKGNTYEYEFVITNMSFSPANTSTYNFADKLKFSISVSEPTVSSGGFITDVRWGEVKEKPALSEFSGYKSASCGAGWVTVAESSGSRGYASVYVWDTESSDHSFIHMDVFRSYADQGITVINTGGHAQRITGARWIRSSDNTYGRKKLQVYVSTTSVYRVIVKDRGVLSGFDNTIDSVTPKLENMASGYSGTGTEVNGLSGFGGSMGVANRLRIGGGTAWHSANDGAGSGLDADKLDGYQASDFVRKAEQKFTTQDGWLRENGDNDHFKVYGNSRTVVMRTDGTTQYGSNGSYPFIWLYGGDSTSNRLMILNSSGDVWFKKKGEWLGSLLDGKLGKTAKAADSDKLDGLHASSFSRTDHGHTGLSSNSWGGIRSINQYGYIDFGPANESHAHIYTDRPDFYFNKELEVNGKRVWHSGNTADVAKKSVKNTFTTDQVITGTGTIGANYNNASNGWLFIGAGSSGLGLDNNEIACSNDLIVSAPRVTFGNPVYFSSTLNPEGGLYVGGASLGTNQVVALFKHPSENTNIAIVGKNSATGAFRLEANADGDLRVQTANTSGVYSSSNGDVGTIARFYRNGDMRAVGVLHADGGIRQDGHTILNGSDTWVRTKGDQGIYFSSYGGGLRMIDSTWIRTYNGKAFFSSSTNTLQSINTDGGIRFKHQLYSSNPTGEGGIVGNYKTIGYGVDQMIWTIGTDWRTHSTHYGLGYHYGSEIGYGNRHQIVLKQNGSIGTYLSMNGYARFNGIVKAQATNGTISRVITYDDFLPATPPAGLENTITAEWIGAGAINARHLQVNSLVNNGGTYTSFKVAPDASRPLALSKTDSSGNEVAPIFYVDTKGNGFFDGKLSKDTVDIDSIQEEARKQINPYYVGTVSGGTQSVTNKALSSGGTYVLPAISVLGGKVNLSWTVKGGTAYRNGSAKKGYSAPTWRVEIFRGTSTSSTRIVNRTYTGSAYEYRDNEYGSPSNGLWEGSASIHINDQFSDNSAGSGQRYTIRVTRLSGTSLSINVASFIGKSPAFKQIQMKYEYTSLYYNAAGLGSGNITLADDYDKFEFLVVEGSEDNDDVMGLTIIPTYAVKTDVDKFDNKQFMLSSPMYDEYWRVSLSGKRGLIERGENSLIRRIWGVNIVEKV